MANNPDNSLVQDFQNYTTVLVNISSFSYLFKSIDCLENKEESGDLTIPTIAIALISSLMLLSILKTIVIYLAYYWIILPKAVYHLIRILIKTKCKIRIGLVLTKIGKSFLSHLHTFYSYNFYSYTDPISGVLLMLLYLMFIFATMMMSIFFFTPPFLVPGSIPQNMLYIAGFLPQLFLQIYIPLYYAKRKEMKFKLFFTTSFTFWFFMTGMLGYILNQKKYHGKGNDEMKQFIAILFSIGIHVFIFMTQILALKKMFSYSLNKKSLRMILAESTKISNALENEDASARNKIKSNSLSKKYRLNNFYYDSNSDHFFEMNDRFQRRKFLLCCFTLYLLNNIFLIIILILMAFQPKRRTNSETLLQIGLLIETVVLNIISWLTFLKFQISKIYLY